MLSNWLVPGGKAKVERVVRQFEELHQTLMEGAVLLEREESETEAKIQELVTQQAELQSTRIKADKLRTTLASLIS
jgi:hypothetical protein